MAQQARADLFAMIIFVDSQSSDNHDRHGLRHVALDVARGFCMRRRANRESIIADYLLAGADHISTRRSALLVWHGPPSQPLVQRRLSAIEFREIVFRAHFLRRSQEFAI